MKRKHVSVPSWGPQPVSQELYKKIHGHNNYIYIYEREQKETHAETVDGTAPRRAAANRQQCGHHRRATQPEGGGNARADKTRGKQRGGRQSGRSRQDSIRAVTLQRGGSSQDIVGDVRAGASTFDSRPGILAPEDGSEVLI